MKNAQIFTKATEFCFEIPPWSLHMAQMLVEHLFCNLLASFSKAENASLLDSKSSVHVNLEKSLTITSA